MRRGAKEKDKNSFARFKARVFEGGKEEKKRRLQREKYEKYATHAGVSRCINVYSETAFHPRAREDWTEFILSSILHVRET